MTYRLRNQLVGAEEAKSVIAANRIQQLETELKRKDEVLVEIIDLVKPLQTGWGSRICTKVADIAREALK